MSKSLKIHYGKLSKILPIPTCHICDKYFDELYECNICGHKFCADHIIKQGDDFECTDCNKKRLGGI